MKHRKLWPAGCAAVLCLFAVWLADVCLTSNQALDSMPLPLSFIGEYSQGGGSWQSLDTGTAPNALDGDIVLRGHFDRDTSASYLYIYADNLYVSLFINGESYLSAAPILPDGSFCSIGVEWRTVSAPALTTADVLEFHLSDPCGLGNPRACRELLQNLFITNNFTFENYILRPSRFLTRSLTGTPLQNTLRFLASGQLWRGVGQAVLVSAFLLLGIALADTLGSRLFGLQLWSMGLLAFFAGGLMALDVPDISLLNYNIDFTICAAQLCRMLALLCIGTRAVLLLHAPRLHRAALCILLAAAVLDCGLVLACLFRLVPITAIYGVWGAAQGLFCATLLCLTLIALRGTQGRLQKWLLIALMALLAAALLETGNARFGWWPRGILFRFVMLGRLAAYLVWAMRAVPQAFRAQKRAALQEAELVQSRITITLSQIQPHFLYNVLNAIHYLCISDPAAAQKAVDDFAAYLRGNLDSLDRASPVPFEKELEHVRIYLELEEMRFENELHVVYDIRETSFMLPALTVQPLVENAVRHGVGKKPGGGTVTILAQKVCDGYEVAVTDDGIGYESSAPHTDGHTHVGIENVRTRLDILCHATLTVESRPGSGTVATIHIPRQESADVCICS